MMTLTSVVPYLDLEDTWRHSSEIYLMRLGFGLDS